MVRVLASEVFQGNLTRVKELLAEGGNASERDENKSTPLHLCRSVAVARELVARGADVNAANRTRNTPLHVAAGAGAADLVAFLISAGARTDAENSHGVIVIQCV